MCIDKNEMQKYKMLNNIARRNSVVIIGSDYLKEMQVGELKQVFGIINDVYNRSLTDLSVFEAEPIIKDTITELLPKKIVLQLGENDLSKPSITVDSVIKAYDGIIKAIKKQDKQIKIVAVSINNLLDKEVEKNYNGQLEKLCKTNNCQFVDTTSAGDNDISRINTFRCLRYFISDDILSIV